jgi:hypothetical protein
VVAHPRRDLPDPHRRVDRLRQGPGLSIERWCGSGPPAGCDRRGLRLVLRVDSSGHWRAARLCHLLPAAPTACLLLY